MDELPAIGSGGRQVARAEVSADTGAAERSNSPAIIFRNIEKTFQDGTEAIGDVSFSVAPGEIVSVVGPSGCGKSTLLRIASNLTPPSSGVVECTTDNIGYVFQDATLLPWRTVKQNVELFAELHGYPKGKRDQVAREAIEFVRLRGFERMYPRALSGGMKMRVSLARSLTMKPSLFLFDEPFGALDEITREHLNDELLRLFLHEFFAGIFVTHSVTEAVYISTRVLVMTARPGRLAGEFDVPFSFPRPPELRFDPQFASLAGEVSETLRRGSA
jgi:NitT/TauT family transport system ATP-binding protein